MGVGQNPHLSKKGGGFVVLACVFWYSKGVKINPAPLAIYPCPKRWGVLVRCGIKYSIFGFLAFALASSALAATSQDSIDSLKKQIEQIKAQISALTSKNASCDFVRNLTTGFVGDDVLCLQKYLNSAGFVVSESGLGSVGNESTYFGSKTKNALAKWQAANSVNPPVGYFGLISRAKYKELIATQPTPTPTSSPTPTPTPEITTTPSPTPTPTPTQQAENQKFSLAILAPVNGDTARVGQKYIIKWNTEPKMPSDNSLHTKISFEALDGTLKTNIAENILLRDGQYEWTIPSIIGLPAFYRVRLEPENNQLVIGTTTSGFFVLVRADAPDPAVSVERFKITTPIKRETVYASSPYGIQWSGGAYSWALDILLLNSETFATVKNIASNQPNTKLYSWTIPNDVPTGEYIVRINCASCSLETSGLLADSKIFTIQK
jgi:hypothetical protein